MEPLFYVVIFTILFLVIWNCLKEHPLFENGSVIISICVSILCVIGIDNMLTPTTPVEGDKEFDFILLPYATLGICMLLIFLVKLILQWTNSGKEKKERRIGKR